MISNFVRLAAAPGSERELREHLQRLVTLANGERGTLAYHLNEEAADATVFWIYELYADADAEALAAHIAGEGFRDTFAQVRRLLREDVTVHRTTPVQILTRDQW